MAAILGTGRLALAMAMLLAWGTLLGCGGGKDRFQLRFFMAYAIVDPKVPAHRIDLTADLFNPFSDNATDVTMTVRFADDSEAIIKFGTIGARSEGSAYRAIKVATPIKEGNIVGDVGESRYDDNGVNFLFCTSVKAVTVEYRLGGSTQKDDLSEGLREVVAESLKNTWTYILAEQKAVKASRPPEGEKAGKAKKASGVGVKGDWWTK